MGVVQDLLTKIYLSDKKMKNIYATAPENFAKISRGVLKKKTIWWYGIR